MIQTNPTNSIRPEAATSSLGGYPAVSPRGRKAASPVPRMNRSTGNAGPWGACASSPGWRGAGRAPPRRCRRSGSSTRWLSGHSLGIRLHRNRRNSSVRAKREGADVGEDGTRVWVPPVGPSCVHEARPVGRVPRAAQHAGVGGVERRSTVDERGDVVRREVARRVTRVLGSVARADPAELSDVARDHPPRQARPARIRMHRMTRALT